MKLLLLSFLSGLVLAGQTGVPTVAITGSIVDPSNAPVPSVRVLLKAADAEMETTTDAAGQFRFGQMVPGN
jgi:protocatechuate 3,4-dioxygenase beta subunit